MRLVAEENALRTSFFSRHGVVFRLDDLRNLGLLASAAPGNSLVSYVSRVADALRDENGIWLAHFSRFCPQCLRQRDQWHVGWELRFADACPEHGVWLIDRCDCGRLLTWRRRSLWTCACGRAVRELAAVECPAEVTGLTQALRARLTGESTNFVSPALGGRSITEVQQIVEVLGRFGNPARLHEHRPPDSERLDSSWDCTSAAAQLLCDWPISFLQALQCFQAHAAGTRRSGRLTATFGPLYTKIYRDMRPHFAPLRAVFEDYIKGNWTGALGSRNRRLPPQTIAAASWVPVTHAASRLGITPRAARRCIEHSGEVLRSRTTATGRHFDVAPGACLDRLQPVHGNERDANLEQAAALLCLPKRRVLGVARLRVFAAQRANGFSSRWSFSAPELRAVRAALDTLPEVATCPVDAISVDRILRTWAGSKEFVSHLLQSILNGAVPAVARLRGGVGMSGVLVEVEMARQVREIFARSRPVEGLSLPVVARTLGVKQEVIYHLARQGFLRATPVRSAVARTSAMVSAEALDEFRAQYVFGRDLARDLGCSPKSLIGRLQVLGVVPIAGPRIDGCRQVVFKSGAPLSRALELAREGPAQKLDSASAQGRPQRRLRGD